VGEVGLIKGEVKMWNYRVIKSVINGAEYLGVYEVYYNENGEITMHSQEPSTPYGEDIGELRSDLKYMMAALEKPVLVASKITFAKPDWEK
jgi:hypothetical protein